MVSNRPLGKPSDIGANENLSETTNQIQTDVEYPKSFDMPKSSESSKTHDTSKDGLSNLGKRKRVAEEDVQLMVGMTCVVNNVAKAFTNL